MVLIYVPKLTNRVKYTFGLIFNDLLGTEIQFTTQKEDYIAFDGIKLNYSKEDLKSGIFIAAEEILFTRRIENLDVSETEYDGIPCIFPTYYRSSVLPFDPFAASFYMVSRYEEYFPYKKDKYGRFDASQSIAEKYNFLHRPVVNLWSRIVSKIIQNSFPEFEPVFSKYNFIPTIDIDAAWAYLHKGVFRTTGAFLRAIIHKDFNEVKHRLRVLLKKERDPFDTFDLQLELQKKYKLHPIYFILFADYGHNDKNIAVRNNAFQELIKLLADYAEVGIHPSYNSNESFDKLKIETKRLSDLLNREITKSRQHFLKLSFPHTYRNLISLEITDDYSMGFAEKPGFRAGISNSFMFYDLDTDSSTNLRIHPFACMEGSLHDYMEIDDKNAMNHIRPLIDEVKAVGGTFISLWHNESLGNKGRWIGWHKVYEEMIQYALPNKLKKSDISEKR